MRRNWIYIVCIALIGSSTMISCDISSSRNYMGTMAGAEIGGVIGEALGWMSTSRHDGPGKAMLGTIVGTVAGAAIGNALTKDNTTRTTVGRRDNTRDNRRYEEDYNPGYQIGGGGNYDGYTNRQNNYAGSSYDGRNSYSFLTISNMSYQDEDGDGRISRNETINIIYEVTNTSKNPVDDVELKIEALDGDKYFAVSPSNTTKIAAGECIRYKAKAFCKSKPTKSPAQFKLSASSRYAGSTSTILQIRVNK